jgi:hypothetical protein
MLAGLRQNSPPLRGMDGWIYRRLGMERDPELGRVTRRVAHGAGTQSLQGFSASGIAGLDDLWGRHSFDPCPRVDDVAFAAVAGHCAPAVLTFLQNCHVGFFTFCRRRVHAKHPACP